jgi:hypothetical protein
MAQPLSGSATELCVEEQIGDAARQAMRSTCLACGGAGPRRLQAIAAGDIGSATRACVHNTTRQLLGLGGYTTGDPATLAVTRGHHDPAVLVWSPIGAAAVHVTDVYVVADDVAVGQGRGGDRR